MNCILYLLLLLPTLAQSAARSSVNPTAAELMSAARDDQERTKIMKELEEKRQAILKAKHTAEQELLKQEEPEQKTHTAEIAGETKKAPAVAGAPATPPEPPCKKSSVPSLQGITSERLYKAWGTQSEEIATIWLHAQPHDDFEMLLSRSYAVSPVQPKTPNVVALPLVRLLFDNEEIAKAISSLSLFTLIGMWPEKVKDTLFNKHGYLIGLTDHTTYIFNYLAHTIKALSHEPAEDTTTFLFSYDGSVLARYTHEKETILYDTTSGEVVYVANNTFNFKFSAVSPVCCYFDGTATVLYNYRLKTTTSHPTAAPEESILENNTLISHDCSYIAFFVEKTDKLYLQDTTTGYRFFIEDATYLVTERARDHDYVSFIDFNSTGSLFSVADPRNGTITLFNTREFSKSTKPQKPFIKVSDYGPAPYAAANRLFLSWLDIHFSPDGTQLLFPTKENSYTIYDLIHQKTIETITLPLNSPAKYDMVGFFSENMLRYTVYTKNIPNDALFIRKTHHTVSLGDTFWLNIDEITQKVAYENKEGVYLIDTTTLLKSTLVTSPKRSSLELSLLTSYKGYLDKQGTLFYTHDTAIEQLMIDPCLCSLDQIFFLLGLAHAQRDGVDTAKIYNQLLSSPLLSTFSPTTRTYITRLLKEYLKKSVAAPATLLAGPLRAAPTRAFFDNLH